jgi:LssY C-terminus
MRSTANLQTPVGQAVVFFGLSLLTLVTQAAQLPTGAELHIRLTSKISSADIKPGAPVTAVLIAPVVEDGQIILPPGAQLTGDVKAVQSAAADPQKAPTLQLDFKHIAFGSERENLAARVSAVDNAKETVDENGVITGSPSSQTYTSRLNRGIEKMSGSDRLSGLAGILETAKKVLVSDTDPDISYDAGVEMTLKTTSALNVTRPSAGVAAEVQAIPNDAALAGLVSHMPLRAMATDRRPSDITNLLFIGTEEELASAFEAAGWSTAARLNGLSKFQTARAMIEQRGYKEAPVSVLLIDGRPPDLVYQKQNDTFDARHHVRVWRQAGAFEGRPIWVCTATHDIGISYSEREGTFIHRIDSNVDDERAKVVNDLIFERKVGSLALVPRDTVPANAQNATGDPLHTDGQVAVIVLR